MGTALAANAKMREASVVARLLVMAPSEVLAARSSTPTLADELMGDALVKQPIHWSLVYLSSFSNSTEDDKLS